MNAGDGRPRTRGEGFFRTRAREANEQMDEPSGASARTGPATGGQCER